MTLSGQQHLRIQLHGKRFRKLVTLLLFVSLTLPGCTNLIEALVPAPGLNDSAFHLCDQYYIITANSRSQKLCKATTTKGLYENVLSEFYVTRYSVAEPMICVEGIPTKELLASEEEKSSNDRQYYLLDVRDKKLYGPFETAEELLELDAVKESGTQLIWETVS